LHPEHDATFAALRLVTIWRGHQFRGFRQSTAERVADGRKIRRRFAPPPFETSASPAWLSATSARPFKLVLEEVFNGAGTRLVQNLTDWETVALGGGRVQVHAKRQIETTYSIGGNLIWQDDPKGNQHTEPCYEALNRQRRKIVLADDAQPGSGYASRCAAAVPAGAVSYSDYLYDQQGAPWNCTPFAIGRLCAVTDNYGANTTISTAFKYDARGRINRETLNREVLLGSAWRTGGYTVAYA
jgi:YD repeat-containing protein